MPIPKNPTREEVHEAIEWLSRVPPNSAFTERSPAIHLYVETAREYARCADEADNPETCRQFLNLAFEYCFRAIQGDAPPPQA